MEFVYFDSENPPTASFFSGYGFIDNKFIISNKLSEMEVSSGNDGAYVTCRVDKDSICFGVDWMGAGRWFYYKDNEDLNFWAVSNSLWMLIERLSQSGKKLTPDGAMIKLWGYRGAFVEQMQSNDTIISEIKLASRWEDINIIEGNNFSDKISLVERRKINDMPISYKDALKAYLCETEKRLRSLALSKTLLKFDLSGGLDSRTTFAFASYMVKADSSLKNNISIFSNPGERHAVDFMIANKIASERGMKLTKSRKSPAKISSGVTPLRNWELNRLGQYTLTRMIPAAGIDVGQAKISGAGGESYRQFWEKWGADFYELLHNRRSFLFRPIKDTDAVAKRVSRSVDRMRSYYPKFLNELNSHYREFRSRMHMGIPATEDLLLHPLSGSKMDALADASPESYFNNRQVYFDIIANLDYNLLETEFDDPNKGPSEDNIKNITYVDFSPSLELYEKMVINTLDEDIVKPEQKKKQLRSYVILFYMLEHHFLAIIV